LSPRRRRGKKTGGLAGIINGLLATRRTVFETRTVGAASAHALAGDRPAALRMLGRAIDRHELAATYIFNGPGLGLLAADPGSAPLLARMHSHPAPTCRAEQRPGRCCQNG
jgi:hypothetical protein